MNLTLQPEIYQRPTRSEAKSKSSPTLINFADAHHQWILESRERAVSDLTTQTIQNESARNPLFMESSDLAQNALYWFMSAPALFYLVYLLLGLSSRP